MQPVVEKAPQPKAEEQLAKPPAAAALNPGQIRVRDKYLQRVMRKLARNKHYPRRLRRMRIEGKVHVQFEIRSDGTVARAEISQNSKHRELDKLALALIHDSANYPKFPAELPSRSLSLTLPIEYSLE